MKSRLLALKVDVDTWRGTRRGVPALTEMFTRLGVGASFLFSLGPDNTGRAIRRVLRPDFLRKVQRTAVLSHYGLATLSYGTFLPSPDIGKRGAEIMRATRDAGFEVGIHAWDHVAWQDKVRDSKIAWCEEQLRRAVSRYKEIFGQMPHCHGAAGWQMSRHALRLEQRLGLSWASDCRGSHPFVPVWEGEIIRCLQLPTTLPTLDELIGHDGCTATNVDDYLLNLTAERMTPQVYTLHAELEGMKLAPLFERLLNGWQMQGWRLVSLGELAAGLDLDALPRHELIYGAIPGRSGQVLLQGREFLSPFREAA